MERPVRKRNRLKNYDYSTPGAYFVTICTKEHKEILSRIYVGFGACDEPQIALTPYGRIAEKHLERMSRKYENVTIDKYVIMPNHIHMIVMIRKNEHNNGALQAPHPTNEIIPKFISLFKRYCNREYNENIFQRSYHDHIIRDERDYQKIWQYIDTNPAKWELDCFYMK